MKKLSAILLCVLLIWGAVGCVYIPQDSEFGTDPNQTPAADAPTPYDGIIATYKELLLCKKNGAALPEHGGTVEGDGAILDILYEIVETCDEPMHMGYSTRDINRDGIDELILMKKDCDLYALLILQNR